MIGPNRLTYVNDYATCPRCGVSQRLVDLQDGKCADVERCVRWQVEAKVKAGHYRLPDMAP